MIDNGIVRGSAEQAVSYIANGDSVYIHKDIEKTTNDQDTVEYQYQEYVYTKDEYLEFLTKQNEEIMLALAELGEVVTSNG